METIAQPLDFLGVNVYSGHLVRAGADGRPEEILPPAGYNCTTQDDWHVTPSALYWIPKWICEHYKKPLIITENGHQNPDAVALDGKVHDPQRVDFLRRYLRELRRVIEEGADVRGYFHWTILDNFEWALGYKIRVGLVHTDYQTLKRTPKDSFYWYKDCIAYNGETL